MGIFKFSTNPIVRKAEMERAIDMLKKEVFSLLEEVKQLRAEVERVSIRKGINKQTK